VAIPKGIAGSALSSLDGDCDVAARQLNARHIAERAAPFLCSLSFFSVVSDGQPVALFSCDSVNKDGVIKKGTTMTQTVIHQQATGSKPGRFVVELIDFGPYCSTLFGNSR
jgi:hypothetical protein